MPDACTWRSASRTGWRLTPKRSASHCWRSRVPTGNSPVMIEAEMRSASVSGCVTTTSG